MKDTRCCRMDSILVTLVSVQLALILFLLERLFAIKKCISELRERLVRVEQTLRLFED